MTSFFFSNANVKINKLVSDIQHVLSVVNIYFVLFSLTASFLVENYSTSNDVDVATEGKQLDAFSKKLHFNAITM